VSSYSHFYNAIEADIGVWLRTKNYVWLLHRQRNVKFFFYAVNLHNLRESSHNCIAVDWEKVRTKLLPHYVRVQCHVEPTLVMNSIEITIKYSFTQPYLDKVSLLV